MRESDWSRPILLRSDWLLLIVAMCTTISELRELEYAGGLPVHIGIRWSIARVRVERGGYERMAATQSTHKTQKILSRRHRSFSHEVSRDQPSP